MKSYYKIQISLFLAMFFMPGLSHTTAIHLPTVNTEATFHHQKELMGRNRIPTSLVESTKADEIIAQYILDITADALPKKYKYMSQKIASAIIREANRYKMDPLFVTAVIQQESSFNPDQIGTVKEEGLMQVRPETARWLNKKYHLVKKLNLKNPVINIKIGTFFLNNLRSRFDKNSRHYISAYNMGAAKLRKNLKQNINPKEYVQNVMKHYVKYMQELSEMAKDMDQAVDEITFLKNNPDLIEMPLPAIASN